jgi:hypothetical protein
MGMAVSAMAMVMTVIMAVILSMGMVVVRPRRDFHRDQIQIAVSNAGFGDHLI